MDQEEMIAIAIRDADVAETGVVATMASVLAARQISILGCSTLSSWSDEGAAIATDFTFVPRSQLSRAVSAFAEAGVEILSSRQDGGAASGDAEERVACAEAKA
jgi:hypothetical protein